MRLRAVRRDTIRWDGSGDQHHGAARTGQAGEPPAASEGEEGLRSQGGAQGGQGACNLVKGKAGEGKGQEADTRRRTATAPKGATQEERQEGVGMLKLLLPPWHPCNRWNSTPFGPRMSTSPKA